MLYSAFALLEEAIRSEDARTKVSPQESLEYRYEPEFTITRDGAKYVLNGRTVRRAVVMTDMKNEEAVILLQKKLEQMGVIRALADAGAKDGDTIIVDDIEFTFMT